MINKKIIGNITTFMFSYLGKNYDCERRQKGATKVFNNFSNECFLKPNSDGILITYYLNNKDKVFNGQGNIKLKYASSNKKSYLIYNKKDDSVKNVDIFMPVNFLGVSDGCRAIALLPAFLISSTLEEFGIQSRISALRMGSDSKTHITISIPVKDYTESSKEAFNRIFALLSLQSSAGDFFAFHKVISENEGIQAPATTDTASSFDSVNYDEQIYVNDMMQRYKNWSEKNKDQPFFNSKVNPSCAGPRRPMAGLLHSVGDVMMRLLSPTKGKGALLARAGRRGRALSGALAPPVCRPKRPRRRAPCAPLLAP
jgi:hypothetical protein